MLGVLAPLVVALLVNEVRNNRFRRVPDADLPASLSVVGHPRGDPHRHPLTRERRGEHAHQAVRGQPVFFLADNEWFQFTLISSHLWKETGWGTIVFLAALTGIDPSLYEAAVMDGAAAPDRHGTSRFPASPTTVILIAALNLSNIMNAGFEQVFNAVQPKVYETGDIIDTFVYRIGIQQAQFSVATAVGAVQVGHPSRSFWLARTGWRTSLRATQDRQRR